MLQRFWTNLAGRIGGPMSFRLILQPLVVLFFAVRSGIRDASGGHAPFLARLFTAGARRRDIALQAWGDVARVFATAVIIDAVYQIFVLHWFYLGEALITATALAIVPYALLRGPAARMARWWRHRRRHSGQPE